MVAAVLSILIATSPPPAAAGLDGPGVFAASSDAPVGPADQGIALSVVAEKSQVNLGDPILLKVELRNVSPTDLFVEFGPLGSFYDFDVEDDHGKRLEANANNDQGWLSATATGTRIAKGYSSYLIADLTRRAPIVVSGNYRVTVHSRLLFGMPGYRRLKLVSNPITLTVTP